MKIERQGNTLIEMVSLCLGLLACVTLFIPAARAAGFRTVDIVITVKDACSVSMPSTVVLPDIIYPPEVNDSKNVGKTIPGAGSEGITLAGKCLAGGKFRYIFSASDYEGSCITPSPKGIVQLCLYNGSQKLDFSGGRKPVITGLSNGELALTIRPAFGSRPKAEAYSAVLSVKIEPL